MSIDRLQPDRRVPAERLGLTVPLKTPPFGSRLVIPQLPFLFLYVGAPQCWEQAQQHQQSGCHNFLCLPVAGEVTRYHWPIEHCEVSVIVNGPISPDDECTLLSWLTQFNPAGIAIRHWPSTDVISRRRKP